MKSNWRDWLNRQWAGELKRYQRQTCRHEVNKTDTALEKNQYNGDNRSTTPSWAAFLLQGSREGSKTAEHDPH